MENSTKCTVLIDKYRESIELWDNQLVVNRQYESTDAHLRKLVTAGYENDQHGSLLLF